MTSIKNIIFLHKFSATSILEISIKFKDIKLFVHQHPVVRKYNARYFNKVCHVAD